MSNKVCAILTCFNRKDRTVKCIKSLYELRKDIDIYLVDDGSTDGTGDFVQSIIRTGKVIRGDGTLFWSRGMALAWSEAAKADDYDYYLWLNDDVALREHALDEMFSCAEKMAEKAVVTGLIADRVTGEVIYGGSDNNGNLISESGKIQAVHSMNGNCVLVSRQIFKKIGPIDAVFHHDLGDVDYGLRALNAGFSVVTTRYVVADGEKNDYCRVRKPGVGVVQRMKRLYSPLGSPPILNLRFRLRHKGLVNAVGYYVLLHVINLLPDALVNRIFAGRY